MDFVKKRSVVPHQKFNTIIQTNRLILRPWKESDLLPFAQLNSDPKVMEYFPKLLTTEESDALAYRIIHNIQQKGWGFWAVSLRETDTFIGFTGLNEVNFTAPFTAKKPTIEIGWRLSFSHWGKGYATEGAKAALEYGFCTLHLKEIASFTTLQNQRSRHVMEKIGMVHYEELDFDHPNLPSDHPLKHHVLYKLRKKEWEKSQKQS
ncbi:GNAT family N-acetyltransferase [Rhabdochlamydiaceae symbiont of Dictyostelium giganteum]|uniref:GNAT family N-acetyltransferase n=1 Tax=Rhabdochlamydiaceae symbiont of Dictyostelium giganteum TaxID=3342349 RepID=UPI00384C4AE0